MVGTNLALISFLFLSVSVLAVAAHGMDTTNTQDYRRVDINIQSEHLAGGTPAISINTDDTTTLSINGEHGIVVVVVISITDGTPRIEQPADLSPTSTGEGDIGDVAPPSDSGASADAFEAFQEEVLQLADDEGGHDLEIYAPHGVDTTLSYAGHSADVARSSARRDRVEEPRRDQGRTTGYVEQSHGGLHAYGHARTATALPDNGRREGARTTYASVEAQLMAGNSVIYHYDSDDETIPDHLRADLYEEEEQEQEDVVAPPAMFLGLPPVHVQAAPAPSAVTQELHPHNNWGVTAQQLREWCAAAAAAAALRVCGGSSRPCDKHRRGDK